MKKILLFLQILVMPIVAFPMQDKNINYERVAQDTGLRVDDVISMYEKGIDPYDAVHVSYKKRPSRYSSLIIDKGIEKFVRIVNVAGKQYIELEYSSFVPAKINERFNTEIFTLTKLQRCSNIIRMFNYEKKYKKILLEYAQNGNLFNYISNNSEYIYLNDSEKQDKKIKIISGILNGIKCMHDNNFIHNDLKPENIVLMQDLTPKLIDFSFSRQVNKDCIFEEKYSIGGSPFYSAPEILPYFNKDYKDFFVYRKANDIYSLGLILYFIISGNEHYDNEMRKKNSKKYENKYIEKVKNGWLPELDYNKNEFESGVNNIIYDCLNLKPENRPSIDKIIEDFNSLCKSLDFSEKI